MRLDFPQKGSPHQSVVVSSWLTTPETMGPRMMALPCPAYPNDTSLTPSYSVGMMMRSSPSTRCNHKKLVS